MPAPPMPTKCSLRPFHGAAAGSEALTFRVAARTCSAIVAAASGRATDRAASAIPASLTGSPSKACTSARRRAGSSMASGSTHRRPRVRHPSRVLAPDGRPLHADIGSGSRACPRRRSRTRNRRPARSPDRMPPAGRPASRGTRTPGSRVVSPTRSRHLGEVALPGDVQHVHAGERIGRDAGSTDRAPMLPLNTRMHCASCGTPSAHGRRGGRPRPPHAGPGGR